VLDAVYEPWPTPLARAAARRGRAFVSGLDLLVLQAAGQVELMTGRPPPVEAMRAAVHSRVRTAPAGPSAG
jgi:shikimate dehydrogenase